MDLTFAHFDRYRFENINFYAMTFKCFYLVQLEFCRYLQVLEMLFNINKHNVLRNTTWMSSKQMWLIRSENVICTSYKT